MLKPTVLLAPSALLFSLATAANDWSKPCFQGSCSYDVPSSSNSLAGNLVVSGSSTAISDITIAAGWQILNCSSDASSQTIRLVCTGDEEGCAHLDQNGAENTLVRLPENCGRGPFARVATSSVAQDQSVPDSVARLLHKRNGDAPVVKQLALDTNFTQGHSSPHGAVTFSIIGSSNPAALNGNGLPIPAHRRIRRHSRRSHNGLSNFAPRFDENANTTIPITVNKDFKILNQTIACSKDALAEFAVDVNAKFNAQVTVGVIAQGQVFPFPEVDKFGLFASMTGELEGTLTVGADVVGQLNSGTLKLLSLGLPGLDIDGILSIGPTLDLDASAKASVNLELGMSVDLAYSVNDLQLNFPPSQGKSAASITPGDTPLKLSLSPDVASNATIEAHLTPTLNFGVSALDVASATIFLDMDASASLGLGLSASASTEVNGCANLNSALAVNAGAKGSFFDLFDASAQVPLFSQKFQLFQKCFSEPASELVKLPHSSRGVRNSRRPAKRTELSCLSPTTKQAITIANVNVQVSGIKS